MKYLYILLFSFFILSCSSQAIFNKEDLVEGIVVSEEAQGLYSVMPLCYEMDEALILYPGGLVEPDAYLPLASRIASKLNIAVFIQKMPFNLAMFGRGKAASIMEDHAYIDRWMIAGHSLGGVMAASYVYEHKDSLDGLILLASYPMEKKSLVEYEIPVLSISGSEDGLVTKDEINGSRAFLPDSTEFVEIRGGNHGQFGSYGEQKGDNPPLISREDQHEQISELIFSFYEKISFRKAY